MGRDDAGIGPVYGPRPHLTVSEQVASTSATTQCFLPDVFSESINHYRLRRNRLEGLIDWMKAGKESYYIISSLSILICEKLRRCRQPVFSLESALLPEPGKERTARDAASDRAACE